MGKNSSIILLICIITALPAGLHADNLNIQCSIRDSLTNETIPEVKVFIQNLNKGFTTIKSAFYLMLPAGDYDFVLEADKYEPLRRIIEITPGNQQFTFYLVKTSDRAQIKKHFEVYRVYLDSLIGAINYYDPFMARQLIIDIQNNLDQRFTINDTIINKFNLMVQLWSDSLLKLAKIRYEDALKIFKSVLTYNPNHENAKTYLARTTARLKALGK